MALSNPSSLSAQKTATSTTSITSDSFTPSAGALILVPFSCYKSTAGAQTITISDTLGGLSWTVVDTSHTSGSSPFEVCGIAYATAPGSPIAGTVTVTDSATFTDATLEAYQVTGQSGVGATGSGPQGTTAATTLGGAPASTSLVFSSINLHTGSSELTTAVPSGFTALGGMFSAGGAQWQGSSYQNGSTPPTTVTWTPQASATGVVTAIEIVASTGIAAIGNVAGSFSAGGLPVVDVSAAGNLAASFTAGGPGVVDVPGTGSVATVFSGQAIIGNIVSSAAVLASFSAGATGTLGLPSGGAISATFAASGTPMVTGFAGGAAVTSFVALAGPLSIIPVGEGFTEVVVTGHYGSAAVGSVRFVLSATMFQPSIPIISPVALVVPLLSGAFSVPLAANDDPATTPTDTTYQVTEEIGGAPSTVYWVTIPHAAPGGTIDVASLPHLSAPS